jgi:hypothetical protein
MKDSLMFSLNEMSKVVLSFGHQGTNRTEGNGK